MQLLIEVFSALSMAVIVAVVHAFGLRMITPLCGVADKNLESMSFDESAIARTGFMVLMLLMLHVVHIVLFSTVYIVIGAFQRFDDALEFSVSVYATLGFPEVGFPEGWRLFASSQALIGFLMIGWSTAFLVRKFNKML